MTLSLQYLSKNNIKALNSWLHDLRGPVALNFKQRLTPAEGKDALIFPPVYYMDGHQDYPGYNITWGSDDTSIVLLDSASSQAQRTEALFKKEPYHQFIAKNNHPTPSKQDPISLVLGLGDLQNHPEKSSCIFKSVIRAWDIEKSSYNSPHITGDDPPAKSLGGVVVQGYIERSITINLAALRGIEGENTAALRSYLLGLSLVAATAPFDPYLRPGCLLIPDGESTPEWHLIELSGTRQKIELFEDFALRYCAVVADDLGLMKKTNATKKAA